MAEANTRSYHRFKRQNQGHIYSKIKQNKDRNRYTMDSNPETVDLEISQAKSSESADPVTPKVDVSTSVRLEEEVVNITKEGNLSNTTAEATDVMQVEDVLQMGNSKLEPIEATHAANIETTIVMTDADIVPVSTSTNEDSRNGEVSGTIETTEIAQNIVGPTTKEKVEEIDNKETPPLNKEDDLTLEKLIESTMENADTNLPSSGEKTIENNTITTEDVILNIDVAVHVDAKTSTKVKETEDVILNIDVAVHVDAKTSTKVKDHNEIRDMKSEIVLDKQDPSDSNYEVRNSIG
ncbi:hypothetical protein QE152_g30338 [Popillia japonica]|uniref:Uncharacterized protein n=1 Tax=Popillia japonica TaxID=7064 RepID=A0AAW1JF27_POPJA